MVKEFVKDVSGRIYWFDKSKWVTRGVPLLNEIFDQLPDDWLEEGAAYTCEIIPYREGIEEALKQDG